MTDQVSRPVQILLAVTLVFGVLWFVALRPKGGGSAAPAKPAASATSTTPASTGSSATATTPSGPDAPGVKGLTGAIAKAHGAVSQSDANAAALGRASDAASSGTATTPSSSPPGRTAAPPLHSASPARAAARRAAARHGHPVRAATFAHGRAGAAVAARAVAAHRLVQVLFYNPRASDDRAVLAAFRGYAHHARGATLVAAPLTQLAAYDAVTSKVAVTGSPTLITFGRSGSPSTLVGFTDPTLMRQALLNARAGH